MHKRDAVATLRFIHEMGGNEDRHAFVAGKRNELAPEDITRHGINPGSRLVENENARFMNGRHGKLQALANAERQAFGHGLGNVIQLEFTENLIDPVKRNPIETGVKFEVLANRQFGVEREALRHVADAKARLHVGIGKLFAKQTRLTFRGVKKAGQHLHRGGLAAPVRTEKAENLAFTDLEAHIIDRNEIAEPLGEMGGRNGGS